MKKLLCFSIWIIIILFFSFKANAEESNNDYKLILDESGITDTNIPNMAEDFFDENEIEIDEPESILSINPKDIFKYIWSEFQNKLISPIKIMGIILAIIMLSALVESLGDSISNKNLIKVYEIVSVMICVSVLINPITDIITVVTDTLRSGGNFMVGYVPVFSSILAASGNISSASAYNAIVMIVCEIFVQIANTYFIPVLGFCLALSVVESINPTISLSGLINGFKKVTIWGIGFLMTIFVGLITIQSIVGTSADTVAIKTGKFMVSSFIPVVGSAISDAYSTIKGSLGLLRGGVGSFGIIALLLTVLPTILKLIAVEGTLAISQIVAEIFGVKQLSNFLKSIISVLSIAMSLLLCFSVMFIISTTIVMMIGMNIG